MPHELEHPDAFLALRRGLAGSVDRILVHGLEAVDVLTAQVGELPRERLFYLPHPSCLGFYEDEALAGCPAPARAGPLVALLFGKVRRYKGFDRLLEAYAAASPRPAFAVRVVGPAAGHRLLRARAPGPLRRRSRDRARLPPRPGRGGGADLARRLLPRAALRAVPNLGAAMLGLSLGLPTVAPDTPQMRELLPAVAHDLLYTRDEPGSLLRAVERAVALAGEAREVTRRALLRAARHLRPSASAGYWAGLYDSLLDV
jgi:glycosyltransferase involved in cell wall biosynthesis